MERPNLWNQPVDRWGLPRPRDLGPMLKFQTFYLSMRRDEETGHYVCYDVRPIERRWLDMWHNVGVMRYYDSAWDEERS